MFAKKFRLPSSVLFPNRPFVSMAFFTIKKKENNLNYNRYGFIVSKKIDKRSTARNRLKRIVRSCFEDLNQKIIQGNDFLIVLKKGAVEKKREEIFNALANVIL